VSALWPLGPVLYGRRHDPVHSVLVMQEFDQFDAVFIQALGILLMIVGVCGIGSWAHNYLNKPKRHEPPDDEDLDGMA